MGLRPKSEALVGGTEHMGVVGGCQTGFLANAIDDIKSLQTKNRAQKQLVKLQLKTKRLAPISMSLKFGRNQIFE